MAPRDAVGLPFRQAAAPRPRQLRASPSATAVLADTLLRAAPGLRILATSREALGITGEANFGVPSLSLPEAQNLPTLERLVQYEAVTLFDERARAIDPHFRLTADNRERVVELCRRLDGIPLAIELAAVRLRALTLEELVSRLDDEFGVLTQGSRTALPRQQTLRATIEWSWNLLSESERALWRRLCVFLGGFDRDAIEAVCTDDALHAESIFDALVGLIDKSIVSRSEATGRTRYTMLETLRQFAREKARDAGELELLATPHLAWYAALCQLAASAMNGPDRHRWLDRLEADFGNLQVAFERAQLTEKDAETGIRMITSTPLLWQTRGHQLEGRHWLGALLAHATSATATRLRGLDALAWLALSLDARDEARSAIVEGLALGEQLDDAEGLAGVLARRGLLCIMESDFRTAIKSLRRAENIYRSLGSKDELGRTLHILGAALDPTTAEPVAREAIDLANETGNTQLRGHAEMVLGWNLVLMERYPEAEAVLRRALTARSDVDRWALGMVFRGLAYLAARDRRWEKAVILMRVVDDLWRRGRPPVPRLQAQLIERRAPATG